MSRYRTRMLYQINFYYLKLQMKLLRHLMLCYVMLCRIISCCVMVWRNGLGWILNHLWIALSVLFVTEQSSLTLQHQHHHLNKSKLSNQLTLLSNLFKWINFFFPLTFYLHFLCYLLLRIMNGWEESFQWLSWHL